MDRPNIAVICLLIVTFINCAHLIKSFPSYSIIQSETNQGDQLCTSKYPDRSLHSSRTTQCQLNCSWFAASPSNLVNDIENSTHNLNENLPCGVDSICQSGLCLHLSDILGRAKLTIGKCHLPETDLFSSTDGFIEVRVKSKASGQSLHIGSTKVIWDTFHPNFNQTFESPLVSKEGQFILSIYDKDRAEANDLIKHIDLNFTDCNNQTTMCTARFGDFYVNYAIKWSPFK